MQLLNPAVYMAAFKEWAALLVKNRQLLWELTKREISERYAGQVLGTAWAVGHPLLLMGIYLFVFVFIFETRIGGTRELPLDYPAYLLSGLIPWLTFQEAMTRGVVAVVSNASLVKQVVFPIELLPVKGVIASLLTQMISTAFLVGYVVLTSGGLPWSYALLPLLFLLQSFAMAGASYLLAALGAYVRDLKDVLQVLLTGGLYLTPILYLPMWVPKRFKPLLYLNPFSYLVWCYQDACYYGRFERAWAWSAFAAMSVVVFCGGYLLFKKLKTMFGNVL